MNRNEAKMNREAALAKGIKSYIGRPCKHGHDGLRHTSSYACIECKRAWSKDFSGCEENKAKIKEWRDKCYQRNKEKILARNRIYYKKDYHENKERYKGYMAKYRAANK